MIRALILLLVFSVPAPTIASDVLTRLNWLLKAPLTGLPLYQSENPPSIASARLGRILFYDVRMSGDGTISCASCHKVGNAYSNSEAVGTGVGGAKGKRKPPPILNRAFSSTQFWDGRAVSLEAQVEGPLLHPEEMGNTKEGVVRTLSKISGYAPLFQAAFGEAEITFPRAAKALADYERTLLSGDSLWDKWQAAPEAVHYPKEAERGYELFLDRECQDCHKPPFFTDDLFHNTGVGFVDGVFKDEGRFGFTKTLGLEKPEEMGAFKTPTLRSLLTRAPYMHDGSLSSLEAVIDLYDRGGIANPHLDTKIIPLGLSIDQKVEMIAFLKTLEGTGFEDLPPSPSEFPQ
jgi:cytochrome c peroxidase